jgi:hypothetical protein
MDDVTTQAVSLADKTEDELYFEIGKSLYGTPALPPDPFEMIALAKRWFSKQLDKLTQLVCRSEQVRSFSKQDVKTHETIVTVTTALDVAGHHFLGGVPAVTVSALLVRFGLHKFCASVWEAEPGEGPGGRPE